MLCLEQYSYISRLGLRKCPFSTPTQSFLDWSIFRLDNNIRQSPNRVEKRIQLSEHLMCQATTRPEYILVSDAELAASQGRREKSLNQAGEGPKPWRLHPCYPHSEQMRTHLTVGVGTDHSRLFTSLLLVTSAGVELRTS